MADLAPLKSKVALFCLLALPWPGASAQGTGAVIPSTKATALDGHDVSLPADLHDRFTVLIVGFGRHSQDATTAWEKPVRTQLAHTPDVGFYDMAMIAEVPGFARSWVVRAIKHDVPDVLKPNFLPLMGQEAEWKQAAGYVSSAPDAAYVLVVDQHGHIRWSTHDPFSDVGWRHLKEVTGGADR